MSDTVKQAAAQLRKAADAFDPPPLPARLPSGDITVDEAADRLRGAAPGKSINIGFSFWYHSGAASGKANAEAYVADFGPTAEAATLREAVADKLRQIEAANRPAAVPAETMANACEVIAAATADAPDGEG